MAPDGSSEVRVGVSGWLGSVKPQEACNSLLSELYPNYYEGISATKSLAVQEVVPVYRNDALIKVSFAAI